jgi:hypothetical protein
VNARTRKSAMCVPETLEVRQMLSAKSVFVLDFTPDYRSMGSLQETFSNVRFANGSVPAMFDFDRNGQLTGNDVRLAANEITSRVRGYFSSYLAANRVSIIAGDINAGSNQLLGDQWLRYGLRTNAVTVSVMYFGGRSAGGEYGRAPLALDGYNVEGFGEVYVRTIAVDTVNRNPRATPTEFAISVASTTAHELGHMMGLRHATSGPANNVMVPGRGRANNYFPNQAVSTEAGRAQNPHHELWYSFQGQPSYYRVVSYGLPDPAIEHVHEHGEEHSHSWMEDGVSSTGQLLMSEEEAALWSGPLTVVEEPGLPVLNSVDSYFAGLGSEWDGVDRSNANVQNAELASRLIRGGTVAANGRPQTISGQAFSGASAVEELFADHLDDLSLWWTMESAEFRQYSKSEVTRGRAVEETQKPARRAKNHPATSKAMQSVGRRHLQLDETTSDDAEDPSLPAVLDGEAAEMLADGLLAVPIADIQGPLEYVMAVTLLSECPEPQCPVAE